MGGVPTWTGAEANALRAAMRLSLRAFAEFLGVSLGTVALWNRRAATVTPKPEMQSVLDTALGRASPEVQARFEAATAALRTSAGSGRGRAQSAGFEAISGGEADPQRGEGRRRAGADEVFLTVQVNGRSVTLPLDVVAEVARTSIGTSRNAALVSGRDTPRGSTGVATDERAYELFVRGYGLLGANDRREIEMAQALLQRAVNRDPHFARAIGARGYTIWRQYFAGWAGHSQALLDAFHDVDAALEVDPGSVVAHMTFIRACWDMGWHERALEAGRAIYERNPESLDATVAFARALTNAGLAQYALPLVASVLEVDPTHPAAVKLNVWCHLTVGDHAGTLELSREYLARNPTDANTRWAVALAAGNLPEGEDAIAIAEDGLKADPEDATLWVLLGYLHRLYGDEVQAGRVWSQGLQRTSGDGIANPRTAAWRANMLAGAGDVRGAAQVVEALRAAEPRNGYLQYRLAHVLAELGRCQDAVAILGSAVANGFLSVQLLRQERILGLAKLRDTVGFEDVLLDLDSRVQKCQRKYAADLPTAEVGAGWFQRGESG